MSEPVAWITAGHLREVSNGNSMLCYCSPEKDRFTSVPIYDPVEIERKDAAIAELVEALAESLDRMDRAWAILVDDNPGPTCNWGLLDTTGFRAAIAKYDTTTKEA